MKTRQEQDPKDAAAKAQFQAAYEAGLTTLSDDEIIALDRKARDESWGDGRRGWNRCMAARLIRAEWDRRAWARIQQAQKEQEAALARQQQERRTLLDDLTDEQREAHDEAVRRYIYNDSRSRHANGRFRNQGGRYDWKH